jgi:hypothetical protein
MAGSFIKVDYEENITAALRGLLEADQDLSGPFADIGEVLLASTQDRFEQGVSPFGFAWSPLDPGYAASKRKRGSRGASAMCSPHPRG